ncbi:MAG: hypothetical protein HS116_17900 [Planctomycetes bacterium]|nr:hypothetical protein [Planctomycetota bacterium]
MQSEKELFREFLKDNARTDAVDDAEIADAFASKFPALALDEAALDESFGRWKQERRERGEAKAALLKRLA